MATTQRNAINSLFTKEADGFTFGGGTIQRTLKVIGGDAEINQDLTTDANGTLAGLTLSGLDASKPVFTDGAKALVSGNIYSVITYTTVTGDVNPAAINNGYITNLNAGGVPLQIYLPGTFAIGDRIEILGLGTEGWKVIAAAGDTIQFGDTVTKSGGYILTLADSKVGGSILLVCSVANATWNVLSATGNFDVETS